MPDEESRENIGGEPYSNASIDTPIQPAGHAKPPRVATDADANSNIQKIEKLEEDIRAGEKWLIFIGIATLVINVTIACIYYGQLKEMRKATQATRDAVDISSRTLAEAQSSNARQYAISDQTRSDANKTAESSAMQSAKALQASIDNFHQDQRAWVGIAGNGHINESIVDGSPLKVRIDFQNFGKTPAFNERGIAKILTRPIAVPLPSFDTYSLAEASAPITLMPGVSAGVTIETNTPSAEGNVMTMDKTTIGAINSGALEVYLYGSQWYDDAFNKPHRTDFCLLYTPRTNGWGSCNRHNHAD